jgi:putative transposase
MPDKPGLCSLRKGRYSEPGRIYHVTTATHDRRPVFTDWPLAIAAIRAFTAITPLNSGQLLAWVLMPDHVHWLLQLGEHPLSPCIKRLKAVSARAVNQRSGERGMLWQEGFYDRAVRREDDVLTIARYIVANPVRARLVRRVGDYPFWDAVWLGG